jgi:hypothetical protein
MFGGGGRADVSKGKRCGPSKMFRAGCDGQARISPPKQGDGPVTACVCLVHLKTKHRR